MNTRALVSEAVYYGQQIDFKDLPLSKAIIRKQLEARGWRHLGYGGFKVAMGKGKVVVKFGDCGPDLYFHRRLNKAGIGHLIPKTFFRSSKCIVQRRVKESEISAKEMERIRELAKEHGLCLDDVYTWKNVGRHRGRVFVFDGFASPFREDG